MGQPEAMGLISWTGRLLAGSMAPVAGSGHLILRLPSHGRRDGKGK
jgi:hypothetical protein